MKPWGYVYILFNTVTHKVYVGRSRRVRDRFKEHMKCLRGGYHANKDLQEDYCEYGDHIQFKIIDTIRTFSERTKEKEWMIKLKTYDSRYGYNQLDPVFTNAEKYPHGSNGGERRCL